MKRNGYSAIDFFCGCGGISLGLEMAGFSVLAGIDIEKKYLKTFIHNFPHAKAICDDLRRVEAENLLSSLGLKRGELDLLAGGPPCQGFSKNVPRSRREADSSNNLLMETYLDFCEQIYPKWILIENVAEMRNGFNAKYTQKINEKLTSLGYEIIDSVYNSADFGVPQKRRRAFFLARRDGVPSKSPQPNFFKKEGGFDFEENNYVTVWDAISDFPSIKQGEGIEPGTYASAPKNKYQEAMRSKQEKYFNHIARKLQPIQDERLQSLKPGEGIKDLPDEIKPKSGYSGAYGILEKDMICPTITRWVFHPGSGRWGHPVDKRLITIREAARLHGYNDDFRFIGTYIEQAGQIGNSVPPILARQIAMSFFATSRHSVTKP
ncbi:MAG: DNA cytosine methyltransferase [Treponema sp.]|jgi:DNA (cytosine-5)-methyltransferase 1|nr:DNA cytosine methyltransferase [Treponema sp.]